ncbi:outer membrane protein assembly factor BamA [Epibacterium ulvae]|uniref:outer membrane protein assembly factor BamA n=1 Tax=Epibacterium ulvae TaxID=1156985 RepID=UPI001BFCB005|nr:outer membrane protein assembly factor BamA [Epibacterium ulvae]MBT8156031.1 outer membrane protein assembly factor BamA [Epibacterium ulvae]
MARGFSAGTSCVGGVKRSNILFRNVSAVALSVALGLAATPNFVSAQSFQFNNVRVEGNQRIQTSTIVAYTGLEQGSAVSAGELNDAYQRILDSGVFETVELVPSGNTLVIKVTEFPTISQIAFEGNRRLKDDALREIVESAPRRVFNPETAERDADLIAELYSARGRIASQVTPRIIRRSDNRVDLVFEIAEGDTTEVERVSFVGNRQFSDRRLRRVLETKQANFLRTFINRDTLVQDRLEFDKQVLRDFYLSRGYVDFRVNSANAELTPERDGVFLVVDVTEGQQFKFGNVSVVSEIPEADADYYQRAIRVKPGVVYNPALVDSEMVKLERLAVRQGIDFMRVEPRIVRNDRDLTLDLELALVRGPRIFVERIDIEGNTTTLDRVIRQKFRTAEGDPYNPREIRETAERIRALGFFSDSNVDVREGSTEDQVIVDVDVVEQPTGSLSIGGAFSAEDGIGVVLGLSENNFLGRGQRLSLNLSTAEENQEYSVSFTEPHLLGRDLQLDLDFGLATSDSSFASYDTERVFFSPAISFALNGYSNLSLRYTWDNTELQSRGEDSLGNPVSGPVISNEIGFGERAASSVGFTYTFDSRLEEIDPTRSFLFEVGADYAGLGGDSEYIRSTARIVAEKRIFNEEVTLRATVEAGAFQWQGGDFSRTTDRFLLGPNQLRGFDPNGIGPRDISSSNGTSYTDSLGGNYFAVARFDAEFPLGLPEELGLRGGLFYDIGNVWGLNDVDTSGGTIVGREGSYRHVIGFSLLWTTAIGPLRFNFSKPISSEEFDQERNFDLTLQARF